MKNLAIIGGGSWGTALAMVLAPRFERVRLWVYEPDLVERIRANRENDVYLPGFRVPDNVEVHNELAPALGDAAIVLGVMPSHLARGLYKQMAPHLDPAMHLVSATKGLEIGTLMRVSEVIHEVIREVIEPRFPPRSPGKWPAATRPRSLWHPSIANWPRQSRALFPVRRFASTPARTP